MTPSEGLHIEAAAYANGRREAYLDLMEKGSVQKLDREMIGWVWLAHYEGYRDATQAREPLSVLNCGVATSTKSET